MNHTLDNGRLKIGTCSLGAELQSIQTPDGHEYLWQGDAKYWGRSSPILFPIIGGLVEDRYELDGKQYPLQPHGFARNMEFSVETQTNNSITYSCQATDETLAQFPFNFRLDIIYTLNENSLSVEYQVQNLDATEMLFCIGGHPAFNCPMDDSLSFEDYQIVFSENESLVRHIKDGELGLLDGKTEPFLENHNSLDLSYDTFNRGAIIFSGYKSKSISLQSATHSRKIAMTLDKFTWFGIWTPKDKQAPFVCLEPWFGVDSTIGDIPDLRKKQGIVTLQPEKRFQSVYSIEVT